MMNYIYEGLMLAESGVVSLIIDPPGRGRPNDMQKMNRSELRLIPCGSDSLATATVAMPRRISVRAIEGHPCMS